MAFKRSFRVILCNADNDPSKEAAYVRELRSYRIAGLLIIPANGADIAGHPRAYASAAFQWFALTGSRKAGRATLFWWLIQKVLTWQHVI